MLLPSPMDLVKDVAKVGIYINSIAPGACETEMARGFDYGIQALPLSGMGQLEDMAEASLFLASDVSNYITGHVLNVDGGWIMA